MNSRGVGVLEAIVGLCAIVGSIGGLYFGYNTMTAPATPQGASGGTIIIDASGKEHPIELKPGHTYNAEIRPDGTIVIREK